MSKPKEPEIDIFPKSSIVDKILPYVLCAEIGILVYAQLMLKIIEAIRGGQ